MHKSRAPRKLEHFVVFIPRLYIPVSSAAGRENALARAKVKRAEVATTFSLSLFSKSWWLLFFFSFLTESRALFPDVRCAPNVRPSLRCSPLVAHCWRNFGWVSRGISRVESRGGNFARVILNPGFNRIFIFPSL